MRASRRLASAGARLPAFPAVHIGHFRCCGLALFSSAPSSSDAELVDNSALVRIVSAESATFAARRHLGLVNVPSHLSEPPIQVTRDLGLRPKDVRTIAVQLNDKLRFLSQSAARGGMHARPHYRPSGARIYPPADPPALAVASTLRGEDGIAPEPAVIRKLIRGLPAPGAPTELNLETGRFENPKKARSAGTLVAPRYDAKQVLAFTATQMPGRFAAFVRVLDEIRFRFPEFEPTRVLDYASGPGAAIWAALQVWKGRVQHVTAVEERPAMVRAGLQFQAALSDSGGNVPSIRWISRLPRPVPPSDTGAREPPDLRRYDLVICAHELVNMPDREARRRLVRDLWSRTGGLLLILEPGTPLGSSLMREARALILEEERKRVSQRQAAEQELVRLSEAHVGLETGDTSLSAGHVDLEGDAGLRATLPAAALPSAIATACERSQAVRDAAKRASRLARHATGAHVLAPCPHDGMCPMDRAPTPAWCHFSQRFERTHLHRMCHVKKGQDNMPKNWQYQRFSYVVLRRGPRPPAAPDVFVEPLFREYEEDVLDFTPPALLERARRGEPVLAPEVYELLVQRDAREAAERLEEERADAAEEMAGWDGGAQWGSSREAPDVASSTDPDEVEVAGEDDSDEGARAALRSYLSAVSGNVAPLQPQVRSLQDVAPTSTGGLQARASGAGARVAGGAPAANAAMGLIVHAREGAPRRAVDLATNSDLRDGAWLRGRDWVKEDPIGVAASRLASRNWSRVVRKPLIRKRHVLLDLCVSSPDHSVGAIERHIIARSDRRRAWMGPAAYRMARSAKWGDLWPSVYHKNKRVRRWC